MNKREAASILEKLRAYYPIRNDLTASQMLDAWYDILEPYEFDTVREAVVTFARTDKRDYPTFPSPALILNGIKTVEQSTRKIINGIMVKLVYEKEYAALTPEQARMITEDLYDELLAEYGPEDRINRRDEIIRKIETAHWKRRHQS